METIYKVTPFKPNGKMRVFFIVTRKVIQIVTELVIPIVTETPLQIIGETPYSQSV